MDEERSRLRKEQMEQEEKRKREEEAKQKQMKDAERRAAREARGEDPDAPSEDSASDTGTKFRDAVQGCCSGMQFCFGSPRTYTYTCVHLYLTTTRKPLYIRVITDTDAESGDSDDEFHQRAGDEKDFQGRVSNCLLTGF